MTKQDSEIKKNYSNGFKKENKFDGYFRKKREIGKTKKLSDPTGSARPSYMIVDSEGNPAPQNIKDSIIDLKIVLPILDENKNKGRVKRK